MYHIKAILCTIYVIQIGTVVYGPVADVDWNPFLNATIDKPTLSILTFTFGQDD